MAARRVFLGWDQPPLELAGAWLLEHHGSDLGALTVALPGARAGRRLREQLARSAGPAWVPPRILTVGALTDELLTLKAPSASRLERTLAWAQALRGLERVWLEALLAEPPQRSDLSGWMRLGGEVRALFGELAAEGLDFEAVLEGPARRAGGGGELARWRALGAAQERMARSLDDAGLSDPHLGRLAALDDGRIDRTARVILIGAVETNALVRRLLEALVDVTALVLAPEELAEGFDALGCVLPAFWTDRDTDLALEAWQVVDQPADQARVALDCLARYGPEAYAPEEVTLGVADDEVVPYLRRRLGELGVRARDAAGTPLGQTAPLRLLAGVASFLARPSFEGLAALVRHPDVEDLLRRREDLREVCPATFCDELHAARLPHALTGDGVPSTLQRAVAELLGPLLDGAARPLAAWAAPLRALLERLYGERELDRDAAEDQRLLSHALGALGDALTELEGLPAGLAPEARAPEALQLLLASLASHAVPPRPPVAGEPTVELLGWLELPLDDAPALVVTGFGEGRVPDAIHGHPWLPDSARRELGMSDNARRLARDAYAVDLLVHSRRDVAFVSGRRSLRGDPTLPSRIAFQRPAAEIPERVQHSLIEGARLPEDETVDPGAILLPPFVSGMGAEPEKWSATAIRRYLESPYLFWLRHVARVKTGDDRDRELDPLAFGDLAHAVLADFGRGEARHATDAEAIAEDLLERLRLRAARRFSADVQPAVRLQLLQLEHRLGFFAQRQAQRALEGWRIEAVEWGPSGDAVELELGEGRSALLTGRIDRIDRHRDGRWAIFDYKAGDRPPTPMGAHFVKGEWVDVQLPLYAFLARELIGSGDPVLGYATLGRDEKGIDFKPADWERSDLESALEVARDVILEVREKLASGARFEHRPTKVHEPILAALVGEGVVGGGEEER